jgi:hypothetical protein
MGLRYTDTPCGSGRLAQALCTELELATKLTSNGSNTEVLRALNCCGVEYLVVGGLACVFYGCRDPFEVDDLDVMLNPTIENMELFLSALPSIGVGAPATPERLAQPGVQVPLKALHHIDALTPPKGIQFSDLSRHAQPAAVNGVALRVVGRDGLVALKRIAAQGTGEVAKHAADLARLVGA